MSSRGDRRKLVPSWVSFLLAVIPGLAGVFTLLVMDFTEHRLIFDMTPRDSFLMASVGSILVGATISLTIYCVILGRKVSELTSRAIHNRELGEPEGNQPASSL